MQEARTVFLASALAAALTACSAEPAREPAATTAPDAAAPSAGDEDRRAAPQAEAPAPVAGPPASTPTPAPEPPAAPAPAPPETAENARAIPLDRAVYVLAGTGCAQPANAGWRIWSGEGLSGSSTRACRATVLSREGRAWRLRNSCENTYDGSRTDQTLTLVVSSRTRMTVADQPFRACPVGELPAFLREALAAS